MFDVGRKQVYKTETERSKAILEVLGQLFDHPRTNGNDFTGECLTAHGLPALYYVVVEDDVVPGDAAWAYVRGMLEYQRRIASDRYKAVREMTCCPCLVIFRERGIVRVWTAYLTDKVHGRELFPIHPGSLSYCYFEEKETRLSLQILKNTARMLRDSYAKVHTGSALPHTPHLFPRPASIIDFLPSATPSSVAALAALNLTITDRVPGTMHPIPTFGGRRWGHFRGAVQNPIDGTYTPVYIKFTGRGYGEAAHRLLARHDPPLAPQLLYCDEVLTGLKMIVMEDVQGDTLDTPSTLSLSTGTPVLDDSDVLAAIDRDIVRAVRLLHENDLVHGDLRGSHVVIQRASDGATRAYLLKFNWAREVGQARYPIELDRNVEWPEHWELMRHSFIRKTDDECMLGRLRDSLAPLASLGCSAGAEVRLGVRERADSDPDEVEGAAGIDDEGDAAMGDRRPSKRQKLSPIDAGGLEGLTRMDVDDDEEVQPEM
ncbi:hypothetical protein GSI_02693 [Ganoderma sinense ZZ0214-1]|uniref:Protein kinase domain-containing protein n=1 Tax=Ganoderma sinense ZZ0214-1 TaxID=1077348 RepID=A0A2G8SMB3_9APHY|nr:hypothetical protein GSI_02693 [Ganoderma sinense ZZ0214-1]